MQHMSTTVLILCTGNSCRSQMAEAFLQASDTSMHVYSAGTKPAKDVHPIAVEVMKEVGLDISNRNPKSVDEFIRLSFDYLITVCDNAKETCPVFLGNVRHRLHIGFDDPAEAKGTGDEIIKEFRRVRDEISSKFLQFSKQIKNKVSVNP